MRPFLIGLAGGGSGAGKTSLGVELISRLPGWGALKCQAGGLYTFVTDEEEALRAPGKDTARLLEAGAAKAVLVQGPRGEDLAEALHLGLARLAGLPGAVVEGNSAVEVLKPDIVIFIVAEYIKETAQAALGMADVVLLPGGAARPEVNGAPAGALFCTGREKCARAALRLVDERKNR